MTEVLNRTKKRVPLRILLIEDSPTDAMLLNVKLQEVTEFGFEMEHVATLGAGLAKAASTNFDAVILDLSLPDSFGLETYDKVRQCMPETVPIIIVSGSDDRVLLHEAMQQGADNYLVKDTFDGNRIAVAILSSMRNRNHRLDSGQQRALDQ